MTSLEPLPAVIDDLVYRYGVSAVLDELLRTIERNRDRATAEPDERDALGMLAKRLTDAIDGMPSWL